LQPRLTTVNKRQTDERRATPEEVVPTPAESWRRHIRILETLEKIRETRRRRAPERSRTER
jgi:hypothetical protein